MSYFSWEIIDGLLSSPSGWPHIQLTISPPQAARHQAPEEKWSFLFCDDAKNLDNNEMKKIMCMFLLALVSSVSQVVVSQITKKYQNYQIFTSR